MFTATQPTHQQLGDGLVLKSIANENDIERVAKFNNQIHDEGGTLIEGLSRELIYHHPLTRPEHWLFVEDEAENLVVSALCLIPWRWRYEDVELKAGEMGIVGTLEAYRGRGLIRVLDKRFKELLNEGQYDLSHIQGIPYIYRLLGYEYTLPLEGGHRLELHTIPDESIPEGIRFQQATADDIPVLMRLYDESRDLLSISTLREEAHWQYLLGPSMQTETVADTWLVYQGDEPVSYFRVSRHGFGKGLIISEVAKMTMPVAKAVLLYSLQLAREGDKPYIRLNIPRSHVTVSLARAWGAHDLGTYAWQIYLPDVVRLLSKLTPILERRVASSPFAGMTRSFVIDLYREAYELVFEQGRLVTVKSLGFGGGSGDLNIPPKAFVPLVLGYCSREDLSAHYPDLGAWGENQVLTDTLFPIVKAFIYTNY